MIVARTKNNIVGRSEERHTIWNVN